MADESMVMLREPLNAVMPAAAQDVLIVFCHLVLIGCLIVGARNLVRKKDDRFLILCLAGVASFLLDPFVAFCTKALHAPVGQYTLLTLFGKPAPYYLPPMYGFYLAIPSILLINAFKKNPSPKVFWTTFAILWAAVCAFEILPLRLGVWLYWGYQPFVFMKFPLYISFLNTTLVLAFATVSFIGFELLCGPKRWLLIPLGPIVGYGVYAGAGWPVAAALLSDNGFAASRIGGIGTALLSLVLCYFLLQVMTFVAKNSQPSLMQG